MTLMKFVFITALSMITLMGCYSNEEDEELEKVPNLIDPELAMSHLTIEGADIKPGLPKAMLNSPTAPQIDPLQDMVMHPGQLDTLIIQQVTTKQIDGLFIKVAGADSYFDVPASAFLSGGRAATHSEAAVTLLVSDQMAVGNIIIECSMYDSYNEVSNQEAFILEIKE